LHDQKLLPLLPSAETVINPLSPPSGPVQTLFQWLSFKSKFLQPLGFPDDGSWVVKWEGLKTAP
jgi:hypothetical protein